MSDAIRKIWDSGEVPKRGDLPPPGDGGASLFDPWPSAPFTALGKVGTRHYFIDSAGEVIDLPIQAFGQWPQLVGLCGQRSDWLIENWRATDREGNPKEWFRVADAGTAVIARSNAVGLFDPGLPRRRYGLWPVPGGYALHLGNAVLWNGHERRAGFHDGGALWPALHPRAAPAEPAPAAVGRALEALLKTWHWAHPDSAAVLLGIVINGMLGAIAPWRAHGVVIGEAGTGKTTLLHDLLAPLSPLTRYLNDYTEPGLRQLLTEQAAGIILDEAEGDNYVDLKLQRVIEMLRKASSGAGLQAIKGGADHTPHGFTVAASAILGAIFPPPFTPQDASRFTVLTLRPLVAGAGEADAIAPFAALHGPALFGRAIASAGRVKALFGMLRRRLIERGCAARLADQLGIIAACRHVMVADEDDDPRAGEAEELDEPLAVVQWLIGGEEDRLVESAGNQALQRLLAMPLDMSGDKLTLGQMLRRLFTAAKSLAKVPSTAEETTDRPQVIKDHNQAQQLLAAHGVRWGPYPLKLPKDAPPDAPAPPWGLYVTVEAHPRLTRAFDGTSWAGQRWGAALSQLPAAVGGRAAGTVRIGGGKPRVCWIPQTVLEKLT